MPNVDSLVQDGIAAIKAGRKDDARRALMKAVELDEHNEQGWLWLSAVVETTEEQQICLENVIAINPNNEKARKGLAAITQGGKGSSAPAPAASAPAAPAPDPFAGGFDSNPFAGTGFDSNPYGSNTNDPAVAGGWGTFDSGNADAGTATSVDWNSGPGAPAYGSGKDVAQPSSDEYDSWVSGLSLGGDQPAANPAAGPFGGASSGFDSADAFGGSANAGASPFGASTGSPAAGPFDDLSFGSAPDSSDSGGFDFGGGFGGSPSSSNNNTGGNTGSNAFSGPFAAASNSFDDTADPFASFAPKKADPFSASDPFAASAPPAKPAPPAPAKRSPEPFASPAKSPPGSGFGATSDDPVADLFDSPAPAKRPAVAKADVFGGTSAFGDAPDMSSAGGAFIGSASPGKRAFFKAIPPEIQASGGGKLDIKLVGTVVVLAVLDMMSFALLLLNLTKR